MVFPHIGKMEITELPGILRWAIEGWRRLRKRGRFDPPESSKRMVEQMADLASPVGAWVREGYKTDSQDEDEWIKCEDAVPAHPAHRIGSAARPEGARGRRAAHGQAIARFSAICDGTVLNVPFDGVIKLSGTVSKARTTDSVTLEVFQSPAGGPSSQTPVFSLARDATSTQAFAVDQSFPVKAGDQLQVHVRIDSPIDLSAIGFPPATVPRWQYVSATYPDGRPVTVVDDQGNPIQIPAPFDIDS